MSQIDSKQIAKLVGVSSATVSRVINNSPKVRPETRERVLKVIKQYGYYPNAAASTLAGKATKTIALFMRDPGKCAPYSVVDTQVSGTVEAASRRGYFVLTCMVDDFSSPDGEEMIRRVLCQERADAALFAGCLEHEPALDEVLRWGVIVGAADQDPETHKSGELTTICLNDYAGVVSQVDYLIEHGHRDIAFLTGDRRRYSGRLKYQGYIDSILRYHLPTPLECVRGEFFTEIGGYTEMKWILEHSGFRPTAVACAGDAIAYGAMRAIREFGLRITEDISVIGIDDLPASVYQTPPLTAFVADYREETRILTDMIIDRVEGKKVSTGVVREYTLVERQSVRAI